MMCGVTSAPRRRRGPPGLAAAIVGSGLTRAELASRSGYSTRTIARVVNGHHPGSRRFHLAMRAALGEIGRSPYAVPRAAG